MLGRTTIFRPRPIDINQKLPVYVGDAVISPSLDTPPSTPELGGGRRRRSGKPAVDALDIEAVMEECAANEVAPIKPQEVKQTIKTFFFFCFPYLPQRCDFLNAPPIF